MINIELKNHKEDSMSKKALIILGLLAMASAMFAQTVLMPTQDFATWMPAGWSQNPPYAGSTDWQQNTFPGAAGTQSAYCSFAFPNDDTLFTTIFDCSATPYDSVIVDFDEDYMIYSLGSGNSYIYVSSDGGTTWGTAFTYGRTSYLDSHRRVNIEAYTGSSANCIVAFHYAAYNDYHWAIDNVTIYAYEPPPEPAAPGFAFTCIDFLPSGTTDHTFGVTINDGTGVDPASAQFCYTLNSDPEVCVPLTYLTGAGDGMGDYEYTLYGLEDWDVVDYYFIATDTYVPASAGTSSTCMTVIEGTYYVYEDGTGYAMSPDPTWIDPAGGFELVDLEWDDDIAGYFGFPFNPVYWGVAQAELWFSTNGWIQMAAGSPGSSYPSSSLIPSAGVPNSIIAWSWNDLSGYYSTAWYNADPSGDWILFTFLDWEDYWSGGTVFSCQVQIWSPTAIPTPGGNSVIDVRFNTIPTPTIVEIGIENYDGSKGVPYVHDGGIYDDPGLLGLTSPTRTIRYCTVPPPSGDYYGMVDLVGRVDESGAEVGVCGFPGVYFDSTDAAGYYRITGVPPGTYDVYCVHAVFYPETAWGRIIIDGDSTEVNFSLDPYPLAYIEGWADLTDTPAPVGDAGITITELSSGLSTTTDAAGYFFLDGVIAGDVQVIATYPLYFSAYTPVFAIAAGESLDVDTLYLDPGDWWIEDFETDDGGGVPTSTVWEWGIPSSVGPATAHSGSYCWGTVIDGNYPALILDNLEIPIPIGPIDTITYWQYYDLESGFDGGNLEVSTDGGGSWIHIDDPVPAYNDILSSSYSNPIGGEWAYTGSADWHQVTIDLTATPGVNEVRFRFGSDSSVGYPGWYIDDLMAGNPPVYTGAVEGYIYNCNTYATITGADVYAGALSGVSDASGYFFIDNVPYGTVDIAAVLAGYFPGYIFDITVFIDDTAMVLICMEPLGVDDIEGHLAYGEDDSVYFEICNPTDDTIWIAWAPLPYDLEDYLIRDGGTDGDDIPGPTALDAFSRRPEGWGKTPSPSTRAMGDLWRIYDVSEGGDMAWGLGIGPSQFWIADPLVYQYNHVFTRPLGTYVGYYDVIGLAGSAWMADLCYDSNRDYFWQVPIWATTPIHYIYAFDATTGALVDSLYDPASSWSYTTQRGIGYDAERDVFYMGSWMTDLVIEVAGPSWATPGVALRSFDAVSCAGVAWHPFRKTIWFAPNDPMDVVHEIDPETNTIINSFPTPAVGGYNLAGLGIDEWGQIWVNNMNTQETYVLEGPTVGMYVDPDTFIAPGECVTFALINGAWLTPVGDYCFDITYIYTDGQYEIYGAMPTCVQVQPRAQKGWELITVPLMATPDDPAIQFVDDIVPFTVDPSFSNIYGYNQDAGILELPDGFVRGKGYYLKTWVDETYWDVYGDQYPAGDFTYTMHYPELSPNWGWWLVGNPFNRRLDWDAVYAYNDFTYMDPEYWIWSQVDGWTWYSPIVGGGGEDNLIDAWRGMFVYVRSGCPTTWVNLTYPADGTMETFMVAKSGLGKSASVKTANPAEFALRISVHAESGTDIRIDKFNYISVDEDATDGIDMMDIREPQLPTPIGGIDAFFAEGGARYARITKENFSSDTKTWTFSVQNLPSGMDVTLTWPNNRAATADDASIGVTNIDDRWSLQLTDNATGESIDMRTQFSYEFISGGATRTFTLTLIDGALDIEDNQPREFSLGANVPNPFNATTAFEIALPQDTDVEIEVFNLLGKKVTTLVDGPMKTGYHRIVWNGVDNAGREVSSGIYLYRVVADDFRETRKMTLIK